MAIKAGDKMPAGTFKTMTKDGPQDLTTDQLFKGKKVVLFSVPGAFTPTCDAKHLPGFVDKAGDLKAKGVDTIACMAVNDVFVMGAWGKHSNVGDNVLMLADGNGDYAKALGLEMDGRGFGMGTRGQRFAVVVQDGVAKSVFVEAPKEFKVSAADHVLGESLIAYLPRSVDQLFQLRHDGEEVADDSNVGDLEDRRFGILVDGDNGARVLDAGEMLDRAGNADRDVQLGRDDLARLPHLHVVGRVTGIHGRARCAHRRADLVGESVDELERIGAGQRAAARDHLRCALQVRPVGRGCRQRHEARVRGQGAAVGHRFHRGGSAAAAASKEAVRMVATTFAAGHFHGGDGVARVDGTLEARGALDAHHVGDLRRVEQRGHARHQVLAEGGRGREHMREILAELGHLRRQGGGELVLVGGVASLRVPASRPPAAPPARPPANRRC